MKPSAPPRRFANNLESTQKIRNGRLREHVQSRPAVSFTCRPTSRLSVFRHFPKLDLIASRGRPVLQAETKISIALGVYEGMVCFAELENVFRLEAIRYPVKKKVEPSSAAGGLRLVGIEVR